MKLLSIVGARPNYIKLAAVYDVFSRSFEHIIVDTGQHYDYEMNRIFFDQLSIPEPNYFLGVGSGSHCYQIGEILKNAEEILLNEKPDIVVVYGDTNSALGGALAAIKSGFRVAHVEAGLRSFDLCMPEEMNRRIIDHISYILFAPTRGSVENLLRENVIGKIFLTGDVHVDILLKWLETAETKSTILEKLNLDSGDYIVVTIHRVENVENVDRLTRIIELINGISKLYKVVFPIHPRTGKKLMDTGLLEKIDVENVILTEPLGYLDFLKLLKYSDRVITDSGGVQREAYLLKKPTIVLRKTTEWIELVKAGWIKLYDPDIKIPLEEILSFKPSPHYENILGDGNASEKIAKILLSELSRD
jgi:UDP-N-acetylglucosamine 2-epimerase (non-hydrolysing)